MLPIMFLIIGLGNPGEQYKHTRHNVGFRVLDAVRNELDGAPWKENKKHKALVASSAVGKEKIILAQPTTFMNNSGQAMKAIASNVKCQMSNVIVVHDDLDLPLGTIRVSFSSASGGHKGVQSCIDHLGTKAFWRVRVGIAGSTRATTPADGYVLKPFLKKEQLLADATIKKAAELTKEMLLDEPRAQTLRVNSD